MKKYVLVLGLLASFSSFADNEVARVTSGSCAPAETDSTCAWNYDVTTNTLSFTGNGAMIDYSSEGQAPWLALGSSVKKIVIENGITNIGDWALYNMHGVTDLTIPNSVTTIGWASLGYMRGIENLTIPASVTSIKGVAFDHMTHVENIVVPDSVTSIGEYAFENMSRLKSVVIGDGVTSIRHGAFAGVPSDTKIYCQDTSVYRCNTLIGAKNSGHIEKLVLFTKYENGIYQVGDNYFASAGLMAKGADWACSSQKQCLDLLSFAAKGTFAFGGKFYASLDDLEKGNYIKKRIYTIEEANKVAKPTGNTFRIRYR